MAEKFNDFLKRNEKLLFKLETSLPPDQYIRKVNSFYIAISTLYPDESSSLSKNLKVDSFLNMVINRIKNSNSLDLVKFDYIAQEVFIGEKKVKMLSGKQIISKFFKLTEKEPNYYFILSLLTDQKIFESIQTYLALESRD